MQGIYIQDLGLNFVKTCLHLYWEDICFFGIYIITILFLLYSKKRELQMLSIYTVFLFLTIFNPVLIKYIYSLFHMDDVYYRFFWLLPVSILLAYGCIYLIGKGSSLFQKSLLCIAILCIILLTGSPVKYWKSAIDFPDNLYKVPDEVIEVSEVLHQNITENDPRIAVAFDLLLTIRQFDASIHLTIDRDSALCWNGLSNFQYINNKPYYEAQKSIMNVLYAGDTSNPEGFSAAIQSTGTEYIVYNKNIAIQEFLVTQNFTPVAETDTYCIYKISE